ncbi:cytochrome bd-I oxidase subunit CydX [Candidatus Methylocalor cossyra]|uniref:Ubiquinol oxidase (Electrogenic, proton-motive force generating) n=1 Tax=Candidatus Methylocalor cossyra TaxID=3108543 RepID=A0ABP1C7C9_9GAMM
MWYFAWLLGVGFACAFGIINAMWLEAQCDLDAHPADRGPDSAA